MWQVCSRTDCGHINIFFLDSKYFLGAKTQHFGSCLAPQKKELEIWGSSQFYPLFRTKIASVMSICWIFISLQLHWSYFFLVRWALLGGHIVWGGRQNNWHQVSFHMWIPQVIWSSLAMCLFNSCTTCSHVRL